MTNPAMTTQKRDINIDDLVIPPLKIDDLEGEAPRCANNKARGGAFNSRTNPFAQTKWIAMPTVSKYNYVEGCVIAEPYIRSTKVKTKGV